MISDRLGHSSIRVTMDVYGGLLEGVASDAISGLGGGSRGPSAAQTIGNTAAVVPIRQS
ncbi:MAG: hypothetical protein ACR2ME_00085 [Acidimicrobiia bacterium]